MRPYFNNQFKGFSSAYFKSGKSLFSSGISALEIVTAYANKANEVGNGISELNFDLLVDFVQGLIDNSFLSKIKTAVIFGGETSNSMSIELFNPETIYNNSGVNWGGGIGFEGYAETNSYIQLDSPDNLFSNISDGQFYLHTSERSYIDSEYIFGCTSADNNISLRFRDTSTRLYWGSTTIFASKNTVDNGSYFGGRFAIDDLSLNVNNTGWNDNTSAELGGLPSAPMSIFSRNTTSTVNLSLLNCLFLFEGMTKSEMITFEVLYKILINNAD